MPNIAVISRESQTNLPISEISQIKTWFEKTAPDPTEQNAHVQISAHLEKVSEMLELFRDAGATQRIREEIGLAVDVLNYAQKQIKAHRTGAEIVLTDIDRAGIMDALCDQIVTAVGVAHMLNMDIEGGLREVANSNDSTFDPQGNPIFSEQKKILKGPDYVPPNLVKFV